MRKIFSVIIISLLPFCGFAQGHFQFAPSVSVGIGDVGFPDANLPTKLVTVGGAIKFMSDHRKFQFGGGIEMRTIWGWLGTGYFGRYDYRVSNRYFIPQFCINYKFLLKDNSHVYSGIDIGTGLTDNNLWGFETLTGLTALNVGWVFKVNNTVEIDIWESARVMHSEDIFINFSSGRMIKTTVLTTNIGIRLNKR